MENGETFLEIGVGNGLNLEAVSGKFHLAVGTDIVNLHEVKQRNPTCELIVADRASCFRKAVFDVVAFNPPYVPSETIVDKTVDGGPNGIEVPLEFLNSALDVVKESGKILVLLSSNDSMRMFQEFCRKHNISLEKLIETRLFFESLAVYELKSRVK